MSSVNNSIYFWILRLRSCSHSINTYSTGDSNPAGCVSVGGWEDEVCPEEEGPGVGAGLSY